MMTAPALPQAQTGLATILAALGPAAPAGPDGGGFEQLFAALPGGVTAAVEALPTGPITVTPPSNTPTAVAPIAPVAPIAVGAEAVDMVVPTIAIPPAASPVPAIAPLLSQPGPAPAQPKVVAATILPDAAAELPAVPAAKPTEAAPTPDAAAAASLLIAVATPRPAAPTAAAGSEKNPAKVGTKTDGTGDDAAVAPDVPASPDAPTAPDANAAAPSVVAVVIADPAQSAPVAAPVVVAAIVAAATPAPTGRAAKPVEPEGAAPRSAATVTILPDPARPTDTPVKAAAAKPAREDALAAAAPRPAKAEGPALPTSAAKPAADPAPLRSAPLRPAADGGASMAVLFGPPAAPGGVAPAFAQAAAPVAERLLDMSSDDQWIGQLAADIAATKSETGDLSFRLMPRHLGRLDVAMRMDDSGGVSLKLDTQHEATATIVTAAQPRLVEDLRQQGVRVVGTEVAHTPAETGRQQQQQGQGGRGTAPNNASHLIETAAERPGAHSNQRAADRRGRFA